MLIQIWCSWDFFRTSTTHQQQHDIGVLFTSMAKVWKSKTLRRIGSSSAAAEAAA
jgi:hypothetical protein